MVEAELKEEKSDDISPGDASGLHSTYSVFFCAKLLILNYVKIAVVVPEPLSTINCSPEKALLLGNFLNIGCCIKVACDGQSEPVDIFIQCGEGLDAYASFGKEQVVGSDDRLLYTGEKSHVGAKKIPQNPHCVIFVREAVFCKAADFSTQDARIVFRRVWKSADLWD